MPRVRHGVPHSQRRRWIRSDKRYSFPRMGVHPVLVLEQATERQSNLSMLIAFGPRGARVGIEQHRAPWRGVHVTVVSTISSLPPMIADELWREADVFTDLKSKIARDPSDRAAPREPRYHAPQFLQRATTTAPRGDDDDFDD